MKNEIVSDFYRRFIAGTIILVIIMSVGTTGYRLFGGSKYSLADCAYMTFITISTIRLWRDSRHCAQTRGQGLYYVYCLLWHRGIVLYVV